MHAASAGRPLTGPNGLFKRLIDLVGAGLVLILLSPFLLVLCILLFLDDGWPIFFIQTRVGRHGRPFPFLKFRTMVRNAEQLGAGYEVDARDPRITRLGHFLRASSIDELPQLVNVLLGHMSLIGPRPTLQYQVDQYTDFQRRRLEVRPGLTGLAQVSGRNRLTWPERIELDIRYIDTYSLWLDLTIIPRTILTLLNSEGIYGHGWAKKKGDPGFPGTHT